MSMYAGAVLYQVLGEAEQAGEVAAAPGRDDLERDQWFGGVGEVLGDLHVASHRRSWFTSRSSGGGR